MLLPRTWKYVCVLEQSTFKRHYIVIIHQQHILITLTTSSHSSKIMAPSLHQKIHHFCFKELSLTKPIKPLYHLCFYKNSLYSVHKKSNNVQLIPPHLFLPAYSFSTPGKSLFYEQYERKTVTPHFLSHTTMHGMSHIREILQPKHNGCFCRDSLSYCRMRHFVAQNHNFNSLKCNTALDTKLALLIGRSGQFPGCPFRGKATAAKRYQ